MSARGNGGGNKRKSPAGKDQDQDPRPKPSSADAAQSHKAARKRSQNRISQKCLREKQLAQTQHLAAFLDMIQASRNGADDNHTALMKAHLKLLEENQQIKAALLRMRKKLLSISNSAAATADDEIFDQILGQAKTAPLGSETSAPRKHVEQAPKSKTSLRGPVESEDDIDRDDVWPEIGIVSTSTATGVNSDPPAQQGSTGDKASSIGLDDSQAFPSFDELQWTPLMEEAQFSNAPDMLNAESVVDPVLDLGFSMDFTAHWTGETRPQDATINLSGTALADIVERGCIVYVLQMLNMPITADKLAAPHITATLKQQYAHRLSDQVVEDLAGIAINVLGLYAGLDAYVYGIGANEVMEHIMRWRIKPTTANRLAIPEPLRPTPLQYSEGVCHPLVIDFINWPKLRDQLILLSRRSNIDHIIGDLVLNTVVEVRQMRVSLSVLDLFHSRVFPNMDGSGSGSPLTPLRYKDMAHTTLMPGPDHRAVASITNEIGLRMAQVTTDIGGGGGRESSLSTDSSSGSGSAFDRRSLRPKKHPLSTNYGIDKLLQWRISREFAAKYPSLDCSDPSGMGLAVAESLSRSGWRVSIVDLNEKEGQSAAQKVGGIFTKANVTVYEELANAFARTWKEYGRIDFGDNSPALPCPALPKAPFFANAGIIERANFYARQEETADGIPPPPNMLATRVMFDGAIMTVYLGLHFLRKNSSPGGSIIILASSAGIYPAPNGPLYSASKHGVVGLTRSLASRLWNENIHISCICPGAVATGLMPSEAFAKMDQETFTPLQKIANVVEALLEREEETVGAAVEVVGQKHFLRWRPEFCNDTMEKCWNGFGGTSVIRDGGLTTNWKQ